MIFNTLDDMISGSAYTKYVGTELKFYLTTLTLQAQHIPTRNALFAMIALRCERFKARTYRGATTTLPFNLYSTRVCLLDFGWR